jgi:galactitol-specific phosphotransferase system IIB component
MDLIEEYFDYAVNSCDAPSIYHRAISYWIGSTLLGRFVRIITSYAPSGLAPNLWVLLIGPSRIVRKTAATNLGENIVARVEKQLLMPASFTPEALYELFNGVQPGTAFAWVKDEMGGFFKMLQKKYMFGIREILSSIYMGRGETRKLRNLTLTIPENIYVTALGNLPTPPHQFFTEEDFYSGFLNRFILAYALMREKTIPILHSDITLDIKMNNIINEYKRLIQIYQQNAIIPVSATSDALTLLNQYEQNVENEIIRLERENPNSLWKLYIGEAPYLLLKMATIRRLCRDPIPQKIVVIEKVDVEKALSDLNIFHQSAKLVIEDVQTAGQSAPIITEEKKLNRVFELIRNAGENGIAKWELLFKLHISRDTLKQILLTLFEQNRIIAVRTHSAYRGRKSIKFYLPEYRYRAEREGEIIDDVKKLEVIL